MVVGCSSGGGAFEPPPIVDATPAPPPAPPPPPPAPEPPPELPAESPSGGSGPGGGATAPDPYTGSMDAYELLARSAMAYGQADVYTDQGTITVVQPSRRNEYGFATYWEYDGDFVFVVNGTAGSPLPNLEVRRAGRRFETVRSGSYGQAATLEAAIVPLQNLMTWYTTSVPRLLAGDNWGPTQDIIDARILGVTTVGGQPTIMLEIDLIEGGAASLWLDQSTLLIRRMAHESPRSEGVVTVAFSRLEAR